MIAGHYMNNHGLMQDDLAVLWHPCSQMKDYEQLPLIPIRRGSGVWLEDYDGNRYLDAISSWWVNLFGHANPRINAALKDQLDLLEHVLLAGFSHEPAIRLAERLVQLAPVGLTRCFYADNGSSAVEVALKMSYHYWRNSGQTQKNRFITLTNSYHGETLGALAVGNVPLYKETYAPLLMETLSVTSPDCFYREEGESCADYSRRLFPLMEHMLEQHCQTVCAVIVEPLVQCAGSMRMYDPVYLSLLRAACDKYQVHLIADEVAVGFGRTGTMFACEAAPALPATHRDVLVSQEAGGQERPSAGITPDFLCLAKGLTGGYLPLSAVLTTSTVYQAFYDDYTKLTAFLHSHSYTGNALACRAALATLDIFAQDNVITHNHTLAECMRTSTLHFNDHPHVAEVRQRGMILAIEMVKDKKTREPFAWQERRGLHVYRHALKKGVLLRPLGNVVYFMPPYVISEEQIQYLAEIAWQGIQIATTDI